jgi:hypothetical protein
VTKEPKYPSIANQADYAKYSAIKSTRYCRLKIRNGTRISFNDKTVTTFVYNKFGQPIAYVEKQELRRNVVWVAFTLNKERIGCAQLNQIRQLLQMVSEYKMGDKK